MDTKTVFKSAKRQCDAGDVDAGFALLQRVLAFETPSPLVIDRAGRLLQKHVAAARDDQKFPVLVCGQFTTTWLSSALAATAWRDGCLLDIVEGDYDNVMQALYGALGRGEDYAAVILAPWQQSLFRRLEGARSEECIAEQVAMWAEAWRVVGEMGSRLVQIGYDYCYPGPSGSFQDGQPGGQIDAVRRLNSELRGAMPAQSYFVDLAQATGHIGRREAYDPRRYYWTKQPFSETGLAFLARHIWSGLRATLLGPKKVLVVDLDNTLWGGVVGETGPLGIELGESPDGEAYLALQRYIDGLHGRGVVLAVASKNNIDDAREPFLSNPNMLLGLDHFAAFKASWEPKSVMLEEIAADLRLGLDSFVFLDDNPAEREQVRQALPMVTVPELAAEPAEFLRTLVAESAFESVGLTETDQQRNASYQQEVERRQAQTQTGSLEDYLRSLEMTATIAPIDDASLTRVAQLIGKTNQFNLTTHRHSREKVETLVAKDRSVTFCLSLADKFGDYGIIAVLLAVPDDDNDRSLRIDTWLMSCRAIGRSVEQLVFNHLLKTAKSLVFDELIGEYIPTPKNKPVEALYPGLGFTGCGDDADRQKFRLDINSAKPAATFVQ